jgi:hypothetical protein
MRMLQCKYKMRLIITYNSNSPSHPSSPADADQIRHQHGVDNEHNHLHRRRVAHQLVQLSGQIHSSGDDREPLRPGAHPPETVRLNETHGGVEKRRARKPAQMRIVEVRRRIDQDARMVVRQVEMKAPYDLLGEGLRSVMHEREEAAAGNKHQHPLGRLEQSDCAEPSDRFPSVIRQHPYRLRSQTDGLRTAQELTATRWPISRVRIEISRSNWNTSSENSPNLVRGSKRIGLSSGRKKLS